MSVGSGKSALVPFLPLLYVAWSDGNMDLAELRAICSRVVDVWRMSPEDRERFARWLDPDQPPTENELDEIVSASPGFADELSVTSPGMGRRESSSGGARRASDVPRATP